MTDTITAPTETGVTFVLQPDSIDAILRSIVPFAASGDGSSILDGINLFIDQRGMFAATATDGSRLASYETETTCIGATINVIVPRTFFDALAKVWRKKTRGPLTIYVNAQGPSISFVSTNIERQLFRPLDGQYPRYGELFPSEHKHQIEVMPAKEPAKYSDDKRSETGYVIGDLAHQIERVAKHDGGTATFRFQADDDDAHVSYTRKGSPWKFEATAPARIDSGSLDINFSGKYFAEVLSSMSGLVRIRTSSPMKPAVFTCLGVPGLRHLLMPVSCK